MWLDILGSNISTFTQMNTFIRYGAYQVWRCDNNVYGRIAKLYLFFRYIYIYYLVCTFALLSSNVVPCLLFCSTCLHKLASHVKHEGWNKCWNILFIYFRPLSTNQTQSHLPLLQLESHLPLLKGEVGAQLTLGRGECDPTWFCVAGAINLRLHTQPLGT